MAIPTFRYFVRANGVVNAVSTLYGQAREGEFFSQFFGDVFYVQPLMKL